MSDEQWFSYSEDDGFRRHASAEEAADPQPVLSMIRAGALAAIKTPNHAGIEAYLREMFNRIEAEGRPAAVQPMNPSPPETRR